MKLKRLFRETLLSFKNLLYPPICLHCLAELSPQQPYLCGSCLQLLELINPDERCRFCFAPTSSAKICPLCRSKDPTFASIAAAFEYVGPAASLVQRFKYGDEHYLSEGMAAFLAAQFVQLNWPQPDLIVPIPISFSHYLQRGYNQSALLAKDVSAILEVPTIEAISKSNMGYSQAGLNRTQRKQLSQEAFRLKKHSSLTGKTILLIDDVMTTSTTLTRAAEVLREAIPSEIYALTFCCAVK